MVRLGDMMQGQLDELRAGEKAQTTWMVREFEGLRKSESALPDQILVLVAAMVQEWRVGWEKEGGGFGCSPIWG